jgi:multidrug efflux system outer membrane protein
MKAHVLAIAIALAFGAALPAQAADAGALPGFAVNVQVDAQWWKAFNDPLLDKLVDEAFANNRDIARAMARIDESRAALGIARAAQMPTVSGSFGSARERASLNGPTVIPPGVSPTGNVHQVSLDVAYEVDLWGRAAKTSAAARNELLATAYARDTVAITLAAQVVQSYAELQSLDMQRKLYARAVDAQRESLRLQQLRFSAGAIGEIEIRQLEAELLANEIRLPQLDRARNEAERALSVLLGRSPRDVVEAGIARGDAALPPIPQLPSGLPSDLLLRRPDVQAAEARLRAAGARVDAARAAYLPTIDLTGSLGRQSMQFSQLTSGASLIWSIVASITQPIWDGGRITAMNDQAKAQRVQVELDYRDSVANAFRELRDAMDRYDEARITLAQGEQRAQALERAAQLQALRYDAGEASRLNVIEAQRDAITARAVNADRQRALVSAQAAIARALGGGWHAPEGKT